MERCRERKKRGRENLYENESSRNEWGWGAGVSPLPGVSRYQESCRGHLTALSWETGSSPPRDHTQREESCFQRRSWGTTLMCRGSEGSYLEYVQKTSRDPERSWEDRRWSRKGVIWAITIKALRASNNTEIMGTKPPHIWKSPYKFCPPPKKILLKVYCWLRAFTKNRNSWLICIFYVIRYYILYFYNKVS